MLLILTKTISPDGPVQSAIPAPTKYFASVGEVIKQAKKLIR